MRAGGIVRLVAAFLMAGAAGCSSAAHYVMKQSDACVVAIPDDSNYFPTFYRDQANELAKKQFPQGWVIEKEEKHQIGTVTTARTDVDTAHVGPIVLDQSTKTTTTSRPLEELWITYRPK